MESSERSNVSTYRPTSGSRPEIPAGGLGGSTLVKEVRVTDPDTGGEKGSKLARFDLIPAKALYELAEHYGKGCDKYSEHNWRKGMKWSLSYAALHRHLNSFWSGEDFDPETGSKHLTAAAWHCFTLMTFMDEFPHKDDRFKRNLI